MITSNDIFMFQEYTSYVLAKAGAQAPLGSVQMAYLGLGRRTCKSYKEVIHKINEETKARTKFYDISQGTGILKKSLTTPILPELREVTPKKILSLLQEVLTGHHLRPQRVGESQLDEILHDFKNGTLFLVGQAGSGKTTLLKHIAQMVLADDIASLTGISLVIYIKCQEVEVLPDSEMPEGDLFSSKLDETDKRKVIEFISENEKECLFLLDSVDTCLDHMAVTDASYSRVNGNKDNPKVFLADLMKGRRFPNSRVIAASRDFGSLLFNESFKDARLVALGGLSSASTKSIMTSYLGNRKGTEEWENLTVKYPYLASLCSTPIFLVFVLMAQMKNKKAFSLTTISKVMIGLLGSFLRSTHFRQEHGNIDRILVALKRVSYDGLQKGKVVFSKQDFQQQNLCHQEAGDFTTQHWFLKNLLRGGEFIHFNHVSLQESFAALYAAEMNEPNFRDYVIEKLLPLLHRFPQSDFSRRLVFGILLDPSIERDSSPILSNLKNLMRNKMILLEFLQKFFQAKQDLDDIDLICALHEANGGASEIIRSNVKSITIHPQILFPNDFYAIGSVTSTCKHLTELSLCGANMTLYHMKILHSAMEKSCVKVETISFSNNPRLAPEGLSIAGKIVSICEAKNVKLDGSILLPGDIAGFSSGVGEHEMEKLDLSWKRTIKRVSDMTLDKEDCEIVFIFKPHVESLRILNASGVHVENIREQLRLEEIEGRRKVNGDWKKAPRDLCEHVMEISTKVSKKMILYGWKFTDDETMMMESRLNEVKRKDLKLKLGKDRVLPNRLQSKQDLKALTRVTCEVQDNTINVSWRKAKGAECYLVDICRGGEKVSNTVVLGLSYVEKSIHPSTSYQFTVRPQYRSGESGSECRSNTVITDPEPPVFTEVTKTEQGIRLSWKPAENDKIEKYAVKITHLEEINRFEVFGKTSYLLENPIPGCDYTFEVQPYNAFGRRGKPSVSKTMKCAGKRKQSVLNDSPEESKKPACVKSDLVAEIDKPENSCASLSEIRTEKELLRWCEQQVKSGKKIFFQEIQIAHEPVDENKIQFLSNIFRMSSHVGELELRDCELKSKLLVGLKDGTKNSKCKIQEITIGAQSNISDLMTALCSTVEVFEADVLNLADNDIRPNTVRSLLDALHQNQGSSLTGLDVSFNKNIENWEDLGKVLRRKSLTKLKAMGCAINLQNLEGLKRGNAGGKVKHLDISYNAELTEQCFKVLPSLLSNETVSLIMSDCGLTIREIGVFDESAPEELTVDTIDVSYNDDLGSDGMSAVGSLLVHRKTKNLNIAGCELDSELLESLSDSLDGHTLTKVDMSDNVSIGDEIEEVAKFTVKHQVHSLDISDCRLSVRQVESFSEGISEGQLSVLNISDSIRVADKPFIKAVCKLIPLVKTELIIIFPSMEDGCLEILQNVLNSMEKNELRVIYAMSTESTSLDNCIKFILGTKKKYLEKKI